LAGAQGWEISRGEKDKNKKKKKYFEGRKLLPLSLTKNTRRLNKKIQKVVFQVY
jgi:hypothetical protein